MGKKIKLKEEIKFRKESNYVLICNCKTPEFYTLALDYFSILKKLARESIREEDVDNSLLADLFEIGAVERINSSSSKKSKDLNSITSK